MKTCFLEQIELPELTNDQMDAFADWFFVRCMKQLFGAHSSIELRWDVSHWVFHNPFVTKKFGGTKIWTSLQHLIDIASKYIPRDDLIDTACFYVDEPLAGIRAASFCVDSNLRVVPFRFSFEDICCRLGTSPDEMRDQIRAQMGHQGIETLIDLDQMAVSSKNRPKALQDDLLGFNYADPSMFIRPGSIASFKKLIPDVDNAEVFAEFQDSLFNTVA